MAASRLAGSGNGFTRTASGPRLPAQPGVVRAITHHHEMNLGTDGVEVLGNGEPSVGDSPQDIVPY
ncbi:MAG: hypothetical protein ACRDJ4_15070 [Actinomycetota bacterium]